MLAGAYPTNVSGIIWWVVSQMESIGIIYRHYEPTIPLQVTYGLTERGKEIFEVLDDLYNLAIRWYGPEDISV